MKTIDNFFIKFFSKLIVAWVKKNKYQKHKYDFLIKAHKFELVFWVFLVSVGSTAAFMLHRYLAGSMYLSLGIFILFLEVMRHGAMHEYKEHYDDLFMNRKNPVVYRMVKDMCESIIEDQRSFRNFYLVMCLVLLGYNTWFGGIALLTYWPILIFGLLSTYVHIVFDFDEPDQRKEPKKTLTEIMQKAFERLFSPAPQGSPI